MTILRDNFVDSTGNVVFTGFQHAKQLYLSDNYKNVPKMAYMYFVKFNVNANIKNLITNSWDPRFTALLANKITLPKFKISTEVLNQYNRKTNVQTKLNYEPVTVEFHDDRGGATNGFWENYYKYYYADSRYGERRSKIRLSTAYSDTKYGTYDYSYGLETAIDSSGSGQPYFLDSIDIFLLHRSGSPTQNDFTKITLVNPLISTWEHDQLSQSEGTKTMINKMSVVYEDVVYESGVIETNEDGGFASAGQQEATLFGDNSVYDNTASPLPNAKVPSKEILEEDYIGNRYEISRPNFDYYRQQKKNSISLGEVLSTVNKLKLLVQQPRQAWNVYGFNIKNLIVGNVVGQISATQISLTKPGSQGPRQGDTVVSSSTVQTTTFGTGGFS
jgi:hypothetical protein